MSKILGDIGNVLARILEPARGSVSITEFRDEEGITPVYDISSVAEADLFSEDTRGFDTGAIAQSTTSSQTVSGLPPIYMLMGFWAVTDVAARLSEVTLSAVNVGVAGSTRDDLLWYWKSGDASLQAPTAVNIGDAALTVLLQPSDSRVYFRRGAVLGFRDSIKSRQGPTQLQMSVTSAAFGAGTVRVTGHVVIGFFRRGSFLVACRPF